jgi:hypothetical protein
VTPTHNLPSELGNAGCEIVDQAAELVIIDVGLEGFATVPRSWLTPIAGAVVPVLELPSMPWIGRDVDDDIWVHFKRGWFMRPGTTEYFAWADIQKYGPFRSIEGKQAHE